MPQAYSVSKSKILKIMILKAPLKWVKQPVYKSLVIYVMLFDGNTLHAWKKKGSYSYQSLEVYLFCPPIALKFFLNIIYLAVFLTCERQPETKKGVWEHAHCHSMWRSEHNSGSEFSPSRGSRDPIQTPDVASSGSFTGGAISRELGDRVSFYNPALLELSIFLHPD